MPQQLLERDTAALRKIGPLQYFLYIASFLAVLCAALPVAYLLNRATSSDTDSLSTVLLRAKSISIFVTTLTLTVVVTLGAVVVGVALAWILNHVAIKNMAAWRAATVIPIAIPSYVFTYCWMTFNPGLRGFWAATLVLILSTAPFVTLATLAALRRVDWSQYEVAQTLGLNPLKTFLKITVPQIRNQIAAGALLVALYVLSDFGAVALLGVDTFTRAISNLYRGSFDRSTAAVLALVLVAISAVIIFLESKMRSDSEARRASTKIVTEIKPFDSTKLRLVSYLFLATYVSLSLALPLLLLISRFFSNQVEIDFAGLVSATFNTVSAAAIGAIIAVSIALPVGVLLQQGSRLAKLADASVLVVHSLPGIVMGLALVALGSQVGWLYQTLGLLAFSYALLFMAKGVGAVRTALAKVPANLLEISATLGQNKVQTVRRVAIPLAAPGILSGTLLIFLAAMKELPATLMLRPTGFETLATEIWNYTSISRFSEAAPYALALVLVAAIPTFLINRPDRSENPREAT